MNAIELIKVIQAAAFEVRENFREGYLESVYQNALLIELRNRGMKAEKEVHIPVYYKGICVGDFRADIIVDGKVIIETKAVRDIAVQHEIQLVNYLTSTGIDYGVIINFGENYRFMRKTRVYTRPT